ncbi:PQQ-binding-like beta-propeller repeat protein, partial [candidate division WOR-3 bacterium]|nr:PQQ-binding-like beta-propeller repeat protein [candidate division WOR-3 bacterium]
MVRPFSANQVDIFLAFSSLACKKNSKEIIVKKVLSYVILGAGIIAAFSGCEEEVPEAATGAIKVSSTRSGADVLLDDTLKGQSPIIIPDVDTGSHSIQINLSGYNPWDTTVQLKPDDTVVVDAKLETNDGSKWKFLTDDDVAASPAIADDGTVIIGSMDGLIYALDPETGDSVWSYDVDYYISTSPVIGPNGTIYFGSYDRNLYALTSEGSYKWDFTSKDHIVSTPAIGDNGNIYVGITSIPAIGDPEYYLYALKPDGSYDWRYRLRYKATNSPAVASDGTIYVSCEENYLYAISSTGSLKWEYEMPAKMESSPTIGSDGTVYIGCNDFNLYAVSPTGSVDWTFATTNTISASPAIAEDGT